jgi:hypothetical protein
MHRSLMASFVLLGSVSIAHAEEPKPLHASVTFSPIHLILPAAELTLEVAVDPKFGVAAIGAIGSVQPVGSNDRVFVYEVGVSPRYYVVGNFRQGVELGAEALYVHASADNQFSGSTLKAEGLALGPYAGYKWVSSFGLTLEAQLGVSYFVIRGDVSDDTSRVAPILNLQVGWSF